MATQEEFMAIYTKAKLAYRADKSEANRKAYWDAKLKLTAVWDQIRTKMPRGVGFTVQDRAELEYEEEDN